MKKLILFLAVAFSFSCSRDQQVANTTLEKEYLKMINSEDYKNFEIKVNAFLEKSKTENSSVFENENKTKQYLKKNIENTKFPSLENASKCYSELKELNLKIIKENESFFEILSKSEKGGFEKILMENREKKYKLITARLNPENCTFTCINQAVWCGRDSDNAYATAMGASGVAFLSGNVIGAAAAALAATINHNSSQSACTRTLYYCQNRCP
jgi:hypothetical protein